MNEKIIYIGELVLYLHEKTGLSIPAIAELISLGMDFLIEKEILEEVEIP